MGDDRGTDVGGPRGHGQAGRAGRTRPPEPTRTGLYLSVFAGVVVAVVLVFVILRFEANRDDASGFAGSPQRTTARPSGSSGTTAGRGGPVPCQSTGGLYCFPRATVTSVADALKVQGATCGKDGSDIACRTGSGADGSQVSVQAAAADLDQLATLSMTTFSRAPGNNDAGRVRVVGQLVRAAPTVLANLLPGETKTQGAIRTWLSGHLNKCPDGPITIGGYKVWCDPPTRVTASTSGQLVSTWTAGLTIDSATAFPPR
ncbi:hypothetical protein EV138_4708 [Kribbella voronezhensis]|uniref:Uncharacterized protein n=1 Tax=Kribbella voronezhensis TaxID=2512212 RepID=A0A4R7THY4_9ACTN|nr:hypothetical protein [Kribbella voronezhensis]TDU91107.1 hypothetical protein EV138_4708 [Kribbella voronezhensis]